MQKIKQKENQHGIRHCVLLKLPYFNPITMCIIDPMHNLLLGSAKHMMSVWKDLKLITDNHFEAIQAKVDSFCTPEDIGRIPTRILSGFQDSRLNSGETGPYYSHCIRYLATFSLQLLATICESLQYTLSAYNNHKRNK